MSVNRHIKVIKFISSQESEIKFMLENKELIIL